MTTPKFVQISALIPWTGNLNLGDDGQPKRLYYGNHSRTRVSSQCLKRHWAENSDFNSIYDIEGAVEDYRSRQIISDKVMSSVTQAGDFKAEVLKAVEDELNMELYGKNGKEFKNRQALLLSLPEVNYMTRLAIEVCEAHPEDEKAAGEAARNRFRAEKANFMVMREGGEVRHGLRVAMFGRMVTSFLDANVDAPVHVAHAFTIHEEECEVDHFSTVDDLLPDGQGQAAYLGTTHVSSGIFYVYVVVDVPGLVQNLEAVHRNKWLETDRKMAGALIEKLILTIDSVSPGAKKGSTAPYSESALMMVEVGDRQPRSLAEAFREPVRSAQVADGIKALAARVGNSDLKHGKHVARCHFAMEPHQIPGSEELVSAMALAEWTKQAVQQDSL